MMLAMKRLLLICLILSACIFTVAAATTAKGDVYIDIGERTFSVDGSTYKTITKNRAVTAKTGLTLVYSDNVITVELMKYKSDVAIVLTGEGKDSDRTAVLINKNPDMKLSLKLDNATIYSDDTPCIDIENKGKVRVELYGNSKLVEGRKFGKNYDVKGSSKTKAVFYAKGSIEFYEGSQGGSLSIENGYKHGIYSDDFVRFFGGTLDIVSTGRDGIYSENGFIMENGKISITGKGTNKDNESRGIVVEGTIKHPGEGYIEIHGGELDITTVHKGLYAKWDIDEDDTNTKNNTKDDPDPYVKITGGKIKIVTTGKPFKDDTKTKVIDADGVASPKKLKLAPKGIEAKSSVYISGGEIRIESTDHCVHGVKLVQMTGGSVEGRSSEGRVMNSKGDLDISGGKVTRL